MIRLDKRAKSQENLILEKRYIRQVLADEGANINQQKMRAMRRFAFRSAGLYTLHSNADDSTLKHKHPQRHRFIDMKIRQKEGRQQKKRAYPIHNRILFGHANNVVRRLSFGFTEDIKNMMQQIH